MLDTCCSMYIVPLLLLVSQARITCESRDPDHSDHLDQHDRLDHVAHYDQHERRARGPYLRTRLDSLQGLVVLLSSYIALALVT
jgi:hypothetical protein